MNAVKCFKYGTDSGRLHALFKVSQVTVTLSVASMIRKGMSASELHRF